MLAGKRHRAFRSMISTQYVFDENREVISHPPKKYEDVISQEQWDFFVAQRTLEYFKEISEKNKARASNSEYPYRGSRLGYARLEQQLLKEAGEESGEVSRHYLWKAARINKKENANNERVEEVFTQCEEIVSS